MGVLYELISEQTEKILREANERVNTANEAHLERVRDLQQRYQNGEISFARFCTESSASFESTDTDNHHTRAKAREHIDQLNNAASIMASVLTL